VTTVKVDCCSCWSAVSTVRCTTWGWTVFDEHATPGALVGVDAVTVHESTIVTLTDMLAVFVPANAWVLSAATRAMVMPAARWCFATVFPPVLL
jgi:hypothetical protein